MLILLGVAAYVTYTLNLWGPILRMANAASAQAIEIGKEKLREFLDNADGGRQATATNASSGNESIRLSILDSRGKGRATGEDEDDDI